MFTRETINEWMEKHHVSNLDLATITERGELSAFQLGDVSCEGRMFAACSISKFVTVILILKLAEDQKLNLDSEINDYFSSFTLNDENGIPSQITIRQLIQHQAGIIDLPDQFGTMDQCTEIPSMEEIILGNTPYYERPVFIQSQEIGTFHYSDSGYCLLQHAIEQCVSSTFEKIMTEYIFAPLDMNSSSYDLERIEKYGVIGIEPNGSVVSPKSCYYPYPAASGLWTTASDLAILVNAITKEGFLSNESKRVLFTPSSTNAEVGHGLFINPNKPGKGFSFGWGIGFQCLLVMEKDSSKGFICLSNRNEGVHQFEGLIGQLLHIYT
ncbi:serine hydrolase domain-containing protein [Exiguobacterium sp. S3]|uniref:serine hydrolase domain-containing protein n=1 Tax=Exiguobacterium sp. S3 TaxID=483245 RepID=UPI001BE57AA1|nr:serine hydrolase domain-containing protein [Exiguobacterium sp. S3]